ncbi:FecCD family ABC transporter permease [Mesobacillus zeae]|uniref:Iron ABC transporter permease n=1 Tax=Mesobacillus zeae TaxID=1917180 RepID=A0A398B0T4_9BACI|nr:iron ABC transporter permease [Mesobacillus zeae]RID82518.1 iron ABC transporter permease [Mesobacillus zeae]
MKHKNARFYIAAFTSAVFLLLCSLWTALVFGAADTSMLDVWAALAWDVKTDTVTMIREIRLPREIAAIFTGAALSAAGAIMQGMTRNPLADPGLLGLTAGANTALVLTLGMIPAAGYFTLTAASFIGAALGVLLVFSIGARRKGGYSPLRLVLAGAAVSAFLYGISEGASLYFKISKEASMWTAGGLIGSTWEQLGLMVPFIVIGLVLSLILSRQLTILSLSEEVAAGLGQKTAAIKALLLLSVILLAGAAVALAGNLAFVGLMVPHIARMAVGANYRYILPMSALAGGSFMLLADTLARTINAPYETPLYAIVSLLGLPFFLYIVHRGRKTI